MKKLHSVLILIMLLFSTPGLFAQSVSKDNIEDFPNFAEKFNISMVKLIANPEKYHGKTIQLKGYLNLEFEGNALYLHKEDFEQGILENGLRVDVTDPFLKNKNLTPYKKKYVIIHATFDMNSGGAFGMYGGGLKNITRLDVWRE